MITYPCGWPNNVQVAREKLAAGAQKFVSIISSILSCIHRTVLLLGECDHHDWPTANIMNMRISVK